MGAHCTALDRLHLQAACRLWPADWVRALSCRLAEGPLSRLPKGATINSNHAELPRRAALRFGRSLDVGHVQLVGSNKFSISSSSCTTPMGQLSQPTGLLAGELASSPEDKLDYKLASL